MNTPTHIVVSYTFLMNLTRKKTDTYFIFLGSVLPDIPIFILPVYGILNGYSMQDVWGVLYFSDAWQNIIDCFNGLPIIGLLIVIAHLFRWHGGVLLGASMAIHVIGDIFLHNDDAHRHLFPLSDYRMISEISYWDPAHYGWLGGLIEFCILCLCAIYLWKNYSHKGWRIAIITYIVLFMVLLVLFSF